MTSKRLNRPALFAPRSLPFAAALAPGLFALALLVVSCASSPTVQQPPPAEEAPASVTLQSESGEALVVTVEIADSNDERARGLMQREWLPPDAGMLFIFPNEAVQSFWMKNTLIPLDMIFIRSDLTVAGIVENAEPMTTTSRSVGEPSRFVLEVNGGYCQRYGVRAGARVKFTNVPDPATVR